ncbi:hypothetical protein ASPVEDRAFT_41428 [Aspergillus versicolor CBS 583.65]|uniref:Methyltransferase type 11 domain-containing protein n=1 Tax=Aspergillus versicolor CBS 583.65 TaxID=1036611 RepID=A0A1L9PK96_ASPVE|nr:uncharacterized protein ASPVEDRAFT_41428 [Aspergillus versicolor CBS 583.65]OJJ01855.1 hypothetical protein ASPVEDRAFT_41428 [Aspergillus versicolor CBS 583.65]
MSSAQTPAPGTAAATFDKSSNAYERMTGGCTREVAQFLLTLEPKLDASSIILDNACGTGIMTSEILDLFPNAKPRVYAADLAPSMIANFSALARAKGWLNEGDNDLTICVMDAEDLTYPDNTFTHSYTNLGFPFFPQAEKAAAHVYRTLKVGGTAFISTWSKLGYLRPVQEAQLRVRPDSKPWEIPMPEEWLTREKLIEVLERGGFHSENIQIQERTVGYKGKDLDDLIDIMKASFEGHVTNGWTDDDKEKWVRELRNSLSEDERETARIEMLAWVAVAQK